MLKILETLAPKNKDAYLITKTKPPRAKTMSPARQTIPKTAPILKVKPKAAKAMPSPISSAPKVAGKGDKKAKEAKE